MPTNKQSGSTINAKRFAALLAGFDVGNASDEEALAKALGMRRMAIERNMRIIDLLEEPEVRKAIDDLMQPRRQPTADLGKALEETQAIRLELLERTRDARQLAELLAKEQAAGQQLRLQIASLKRQGAHRVVSPSGVSSGSAPQTNGPRLLEISAAAIVVVLLIISAFTGKFSERSNTNELGSGNGKHQAVVRKGGAVLPDPNTDPLSHRMHRSRPSPRTR